jgi:hypothetical protein
MNTESVFSEDTALALYATPRPALHSRVVVPSRRLDDKIRELCALALDSQNGSKEGILEELRHAIREKTQRLRRLAANKLVDRSPDLPERRAHGSVSERRKHL